MRNDTVVEFRPPPESYMFHSWDRLWRYNLQSGLYLFCLLLLYAQNSLFLSSGTSFLGGSWCRKTFLHSLFLLLIQNHSVTCSLAPSYLLFRISPLPCFISCSFPTVTQGSSHFLAVLSTTPCALHDWMSLHTLFPLLSYPTFITDSVSVMSPRHSPPWLPTQVELVTHLCTYTSL